MALPPPKRYQNYVTISPFAAGHITLPEHIFYAPSDPTDKVLVPTMSFLIQHETASLFGKATSGPFKMLFDLGVRAEPTNYVPVLQKHIKSRSPIHHRPSARQTLEAGGVSPSEIDAIAISHVHWDHHGDPEDFPDSTFLLGPGASKVLAEGLPGTGNHSVFDPNLLKGSRVVEFEPIPAIQPAPRTPTATHNGCCGVEMKIDGFVAAEANGLNGTTGILHARSSSNGTNGAHTNGNGDPSVSSGVSSAPSAWQPLGPFPHALDLLKDGSVYVISAPGHLPGHINLLCRTSPTKWVYLGGDTFHDVRMLTGEKWITTYPDESGSGATCCIHIDKEAAQASLDRVAKLVKVAKTEGYEVEPVVAHDVVWFGKNQERLFPNTLDGKY